MQEILGLVRRCVTDYDMIQEGETDGRRRRLRRQGLARHAHRARAPFQILPEAVQGRGHHGRNGRTGHELRRRRGVLQIARRGVHPRGRADLRGRLFGAQGKKSLLAVRQAPPAKNDHGIKTIALGHHYDDAVETLLMNLLFEGRIGCFQPVTYLSRSDVTQIRPLLYVKEQQVRNVAAKLDLPIVHNPCPANGETRRQEVKELIESLSERYPDLKQKLFGAMQRYPLYGWDTKNSEK